MVCFLQNHFIKFKPYLTQAAFSLCMSQSDRMWNAADRVEDSPWSGEEGGLDSKSGLQWEGRGHFPVCWHYGMAAVVDIWTGVGHAGSSGVIHSYHHIHSCWAEWEDEGREEISHDVHSSSMLNFQLELNGDNEVDPAEWSNVVWLPSMNEWVLKRAHRCLAKLPWINKS